MYTCIPIRIPQMCKVLYLKTAVDSSMPSKKRKQIDKITNSCFGKVDLAFSMIVMWGCEVMNVCSNLYSAEGVVWPYICLCNHIFIPLYLSFSDKIKYFGV